MLFPHADECSRSLPRIRSRKVSCIPPPALRRANLFDPIMHQLYARGIFGLPSARSDTHALYHHSIYMNMATLPIFGVHIQVVRRCPYVRGRRPQAYPSVPSTIGEHLRKRRLDLNLRQIDTAKIIGCDEMAVVNWERGYRAPSVNHMAGIVKFLGFNPLPKGDALAQRLVHHRKARGITQSQFASQIGVDPSTLARWERGERLPEGKQAAKLEKAVFGKGNAASSTLLLAQAHFSVTQERTSPPRHAHR